MSRHRARVALLAPLAVVLAAFALFGCAQSDGDLALARWELVSPSRASIELPSHIERLLPEHTESYSIATDVALPDALIGRDLTLAFPDLQTIASLRVNGVVAVPLEDVLSERYRSRGPLAWRIPAALTASRTVRLELTVENTWTQSAWFDCVPHLSAGAHGDAAYVFVRSWNDATCMLALGTLTPIGFTYLAMYLIDRRRRVAQGWFALQALLASYLPFFQLGLSQTVFGRFDAPLLAVAISGAAIGSVYFTHAHFGLRTPSRFWALLMGAVILVCLIWSGPFEATRRVGPLIVGTFQIVAIHQLFELGRLARRRPRPVNALTFLLSWIGLGATAWADCAAWLGIGEKLGGLHAASGGLGIFGVLQSVALSREHIVSLRRSDELNVQLQARVGELEVRQGEIDSLNDELRRQIAERSGQLADALARLGSSKTPPAIRLAPGDVVKGRYELLREIGAGAMGTVYEVARIGDRKRFAMKVLSGVSGALDMARFAREAQLASHVDHPNVVSIVDIDVASSGLIFLVMELIEGSSLLELRWRYGEIPFALRVLLQLADGLAAIHEMGIVHRDLKPANVLVKGDSTGDLSLKISDFGVSTIAQGASDPPPGDGSPDPATLAEPAARRRPPSLVDSAGDTKPLSQQTPSGAISASSLTETGALMGTPIYMAPELAFGAKNAKPPCDIFSLGVIAHELLTGKRPWAESAAFARQQGNSVAPAERLSHLCPSLDEALADVLDACLSAEPSGRPTARALATALRAPTSSIERARA